MKVICNQSSPYVNIWACEHSFFFKISQGICQYNLYKGTCEHLSSDYTLHLSPTGRNALSLSYDSKTLFVFSPDGTCIRKIDDFLNKIKLDSSLFTWLSDNSFAFYAKNKIHHITIDPQGNIVQSINTKLLNHVLYIVGEHDYITISSSEFFMKFNNALQRQKEVMKGKAIKDYSIPNKIICGWDAYDTHIHDAKTLNIIHSVHGYDQRFINRKNWIINTSKLVAINLLTKKNMNLPENRFCCFVDDQQLLLAHLDTFSLFDLETKQLKSWKSDLGIIHGIAANNMTACISAREGIFIFDLD